MVRGISVFLGIVLLAMFVVGIAGPTSASWLLWLDLAASICAFIIAGVASPTAAKVTKTTYPMALSAGLFVLWLIALGSAGVPGWLKWFNFGVAVAFLLTGLTGGSDQIAGSGTNATPIRRSA